MSDDVGKKLDDIERSGRKVEIADSSDGASISENIDVSKIVLTAEQKDAVKAKVRKVDPTKEVDLAQIIADVTGMDVMSLRGVSFLLTDMLR